MATRLIQKWAKWQQAPSQEKGIIIVVSKDIECLLPWWWMNYSKHNSYPVILMDIGISSEMKKWCEGKIEVKTLEIPDKFIALKDKASESLLKLSHFFQNEESWQTRIAWFKKPICLLQSPFKNSIYLDIDCEVCAPLDSLFEKTEGSFEVACALDPVANETRFSKHQGCPENEVQYNSGVIVFSHGNKTFEKWAEVCILQNDRFIGDQEILSYVLSDPVYSVYELNSKYNTFYALVEHCLEKPVIIHWVSQKGKEKLIKELTQLSTLSMFTYVDSRRW